jgi:hypothetical protein
MVFGNQIQQNQDVHDKWIRRLHLPHIVQSINSQAAGVPRVTERLSERFNK